MTTINHNVLDEHMKKLSKWYPDCPVKEYRTKEKLTQFQLGQILGVTTTAIQNWERGIRPSNMYAEVLKTMIDNYDDKMDSWFAKRPILKNVRNP